MDFDARVQMSLYVGFNVVCFDQGSEYMLKQSHIMFMEGALFTHLLLLFRQRHVRTVHLENDPLLYSFNAVRSQGHTSALCMCTSFYHVLCSISLCIGAVTLANSSTTTMKLPFFLTLSMDGNVLTCSCYNLSC